MKILALEFSSPQRSVAVVDSTAAAVSEVVEAGLGASRALGMVEDALRTAGIERERIEVIAVGLGPGSYTGIRASIALAQGWQLARGVKLIGVSTVEAVATEAALEGFSGRISVVIDAQREELYLATYEIAAGRPRELEALRIVSVAEVRQREQAGECVLGPEVTRWFPSGKVLLPRAATLGRLARDRSGFVEGAKLEPIYLRETNFVKAPPARILPE